MSSGSPEITELTASSSKSSGLTSYVDAYGFTIQIDNQQKIQLDHCHQKERSRNSKRWAQYVQSSVLPRDPMECKELMRKGIPREHRAWVWPLLLNTREAKDAAGPGYFQSLVDQGATSSHVTQIELDLPRTFPEHPWILSQAGQSALRNILRAYAVKEPEIGYCQSMNYVAAFILLVMEKQEEESFWIMSKVMSDIVYPGTHGSDLQGCHVEIRTLETLVAQKIPSLKKFLDKNKCEMSLLATDWFLCLFTSSLPSETAARVWDALLFEGSKIMFRISVALLMIVQDDIKAGSHIGETVKNMKVATRKLVDAEMLMKTSFSKMKMGSFPMTQVSSVRQQKQQEVDEMIKKRQASKMKAKQQATINASSI